MQICKVEEGEEEERGGMSTPRETKAVLVLTSPLNSRTPLNMISSKLSYSSLKMLEFGDEVIVVGNFYCSNSKQTITRRLLKWQKTWEISG
jgi:hypothetical protein